MVQSFFVEAEYKIRFLDFAPQKQASYAVATRGFANFDKIRSSEMNFSSDFSLLLRNCPSSVLMIFFFVFLIVKYPRRTVFICCGIDIIFQLIFRNFNPVFISFFIYNPFIWYIIYGNFI